MRRSRTSFSRSNGFPEGILEGRWVVDADGGKPRVNIRDRKFYVPSGDDERSIARRNHEYFHIKWTPEYMGDDLGDSYDEMAIRYFEDVRVDYLGKLSGIDVFKAIEFGDLAGFVVDKSSSSPFSIFAVVVSSIIALDFECGAEFVDKAELTPFQSKMVLDTRKKIHKSCNNFDEVKKLAIDFANLFRDKKPEDELEIEKEPDEPVKKPKFKVVDEIEIGKKRTVGERVETVESLSGKMTIVENLEMTSKSILKENRRSDCGYVLRYPERIVSDRLCFSYKRKANRVGTILIDCSGSMDIDIEQMKRIVQKSNGATIAGYSGSGDYGTMYVLAKNGRIVKDMPHFSVGNIVDYHALMWLIQQRRPHVWVSDASVTGIGDHCFDEITNECFKVVQKNGVINIKTLDEFEKMLDDVK